MPAEMEIQELRPSFVIGLGGTGKILLTCLRAYLEKRFGDIAWRRRIRLLELDIDPEPEVARVDDKETKLREDEFINLGGVPIEEIRRAFNEGQYPQLQSWFDPTFTVGERTLFRAAHQVRQAGRLAFYWHLGRGEGSQHLYKRFQDVIDELFDQYTRDVGRRATIDIYVISSLCGGTGSGMMLDTGLVLQQVLGAHRDCAVLVGIFTTPLFYRSAPQFPLRANTWAAAQELDYFMTTRPEDYKFKYIECLPGADVSRITIPGKPYDQVYLVDANLQDGSTLLGVEPMAQALTNALGLLVASRIGGAAAARTADVAILRDMAAGTVYSSLGVASLVFPADRVVSWCAATGAKEVVEEKLLASLTEEQMKDVRDQMENFLRSLGWEAEDLWKSFSQDEGGRPVEPRLEDDPRLSPGVLEGLPLEGLYDAVRDRVKRARQELETRTLEKIQGSQKKKKGEFIAALDAKVKQMIVDENRGLTYTLEFLKCLEGRLGAIKQNSESELEQAKEGEDRAKNSIPKAEDTFRKQAQKATKGFFGIGKGYPRAALDGYRRAEQTLLNRTVDRMRWNETIILVEVAKNTAEEQLHKVEKILDAFKLAAKEWLPDALSKTRADIEEGMDRVRERPGLLGPVGREGEGLESNLKEIYKEYSPRALEGLRSRIYGSIADLFGLSAEKLREKLLELSKKVFQPFIDEITLEDWIKERGKKSPSDYLSETFGYAAYMWRSDTARAKAAKVFAQENTIIGLKDRDTSIYASTYADILAPVISLEGTSTVSTGDPHRLTILKMGHGLRLKDFAWLEEYLGPYQEQMEKLAPVHIFPEFNLNPEGKGRERREIFARALAYGILEVVEDPLKRRPPECRIGERKVSDKGLFDALWVFVHDDELVAQVSEAVREHERRVDEREKLLRELGRFAEEFADSEKVPEDDRWLARILQDDVRPGR